MELLPEDARMKTIPMMYPIIPKRRMQHGKPVHQYISYNYTDDQVS